ncbi:unnamed protein product [Timema podura]|uniref:Uncharacterized protein n=1 Tax=Timema podura TaxID=61482 RepID=A0ABN7NIM4_TIMPD|nr:unnamed protein product [Timema podura]
MSGLLKILALLLPFMAINCVIKSAPRMYIFLKHVAVLGIAVDNIFNASLAWKKELHSAIKEGIKLGIVQPLGNVLFTEHQTLEALSLQPKEWLDEIYIHKELGIFSALWLVLMVDVALGRGEHFQLLLVLGMLKALLMLVNESVVVGNILLDLEGKGSTGAVVLLKLHHKLTFLL